MNSLYSPCIAFKRDHRPSVGTVDMLKQALRQRTRDPRIVLVKSDRLSYVELVLTAIVASFWLIVPTLSLHSVSHPAVRTLFLLAFVLGFARTVTSVAGASNFEVFTSMTA